MTSRRAEAEDFVLYQIAAVAGVAAAEGVQLQHVKPHGALSTWPPGIRRSPGPLPGGRGLRSSLILFGLPGSEILKAGRAAGLRVAAEAFADRAYEPDGSLCPANSTWRGHSRRRAVVVARDRDGEGAAVTPIDGSMVPVDVDTICVHGDTPGAADLAARLRAGLEAAGVSVRAMGR